MHRAGWLARADLGEVGRLGGDRCLAGDRLGADGGDHLVLDGDCPLAGGALPARVDDGHGELAWPCWEEPLAAVELVDFEPEPPPHAASSAEAPAVPAARAAERNRSLRESRAPRSSGSEIPARRVTGRSLMDAILGCMSGSIPLSAAGQESA